MTTRMTMSDAIKRAIVDAMDEDGSIYLIGEDIGPFGGPMQSTSGLWERYGQSGKIIDSPISEQAMVGSAVGAAMAGARPIVDLMFAEFLALTISPLGLEAASVAFKSNGRVRVPLVVRAKCGIGPHRGHSESLVSMLLGFPGLKVVMPTTPQDAYSLMRSAIWDDNPVVFLEHMSLLHGPRGEVDPLLRVPIGEATVRRTGGDVTIVGSGLMTQRALRAARSLTDSGIEAEVIDLRSLTPLDMDTIRASVDVTRRLLVVDESWPVGGIGSEIVAQTAADGHSLDGLRIARACPPNLPVPFAQHLESTFVPDIASIEKRARMLATAGADETAPRTAQLATAGE